MAIVYGTNKIVVDRKQGCFSGMKRSVSGLVGRQEVECRTVGSEAPMTTRSTSLDMYGKFEIGR